MEAPKDRRTELRIAKWRRMGPKIIIVSNIVKREWSVSIAFTESDEIDAIGAHVWGYAINTFRGKTGEVMLNTKQADRMCTPSSWRPVWPYGRLAVDEWGNKWCVFIRPVAGSSATGWILRDIHGVFTKAGSTLVSGDMDEAHTLVAAAAAEGVPGEQSEREICAD